MKTCPNCGAPLDPNQSRCQYCGSYYFDLVAMSEIGDAPCYVKFKTALGTVTALVKPEVRTIDVWDDDINVVDQMGNAVATFTRSRSADIGVVFHAVSDPTSGNLFTVTTKEDAP